MRRRWFRAFLLCAFLARIVLPALHVHEERGHGGEGRCDHRASGPVLATAEPACAICEILATKVQVVSPELPREIAAKPAPAGRAYTVLPEPACADFFLVGAPRGPPVSSALA
ncbi:MAG TPA: hypothetical protein VFY93_05960 [Planctomycetota bacterium]|nr:hypothetical protein [Planctomycetota bacterium]